MPLRRGRDCLLSEPAAGAAAAAAAAPLRPFPRSRGAVPVGGSAAAGEGGGRARPPPGTRVIPLLRHVVPGPVRPEASPSAPITGPGSRRNGRAAASPSRSGPGSGGRSGPETGRRRGSGSRAGRLRARCFRSTAPGFAADRARDAPARRARGTGRWPEDPGEAQVEEGREGENRPLFGADRGTVDGPNAHPPAPDPASSAPSGRRGGTGGERRAPARANGTPSTKGIPCPRSTPSSAPAGWSPPRA